MATKGGNSPEQSRYCDCIIQLQQWSNEVDPLTAISQTLKRDFDQLGYVYALAVHDADVYTAEDEAKNPDHKQGAPKGKHMHLFVVGSKETKKRKHEWLTFIYNTLRLYVPKEAITCENVGKVLEKKKVLYLCHLNKDDIESGKHVYSPEIVQSNDFPWAMSILCPQSVTNANLEDIKRAVDRCSNQTELITALGLDVYAKYRWVILDLWKERSLTSKAKQGEFILSYLREIIPTIEGRLKPYIDTGDLDFAFQQKALLFDQLSNWLKNGTLKDF